MRVLLSGIRSNFRWEPRERGGIMVEVRVKRRWGKEIARISMVRYFEHSFWIKKVFDKKVMLGCLSQKNKKISETQVIRKCIYVICHFSI